ncbi:MAG: hypothetical protein ACLP19_18000 [Xanthobacteraceae bacterium]
MCGNKQETLALQALRAIDTILFKVGTTKALLDQCMKVARFFSAVYLILLQIEVLDLAAPQKLCGKCDLNDTGEGSHEFECKWGRCA